MGSLIVRRVLGRAPVAVSGTGEQIEEGARREHGNLPLKAEKVFATRHEGRAMRGCKDDQIVIVRITGVHRRVGSRIDDHAGTVGNPAH